MCCMFPAIAVNLSSCVTQPWPVGPVTHPSCVCSATQQRAQVTTLEQAPAGRKECFKQPLRLTCMHGLIRLRWQQQPVSTQAC